MKELISKALSNARDYSEIRDFHSVSGGSINQSYFVKSEENQYFLKYHPNPPQNFFEIEKQGLELIRKTKTIRVPEIHAYSDHQEEAYLLLEWIDGESNSQTGALLGQQIAKLHENLGEGHGYSSQTFIGTLPQKNKLFNSWKNYYCDYRLKSQLELGIEKGRIQGKRLKNLNKLMNRVDEFIPNNIKPSYLHGDLWGGNWLAGQKGYPYVIDPSFLFGDRHFDVAFTELFGGFPSTFYEAYQEVSPLEHYYEDVKELYQLFYLLVHLNIFGESYGGSVDRVLDYYVG
ncbi:fructosamine kinase [Filobacillus milosensis]|uniref:Fructosamine kinase n=1 Tax=Filobacillus milosensis TaxID=94137 RepID=A0A4Y8IVH8_9BACI|nr:fructosamine kinase family protein [Filobacillus milosensis]TFB24957.1 fructosamine kinase [Filobacillus milosensis]